MSSSRSTPSEKDVRETQEGRERHRYNNRSYSQHHSHRSSSNRDRSPVRNYKTSPPRSSQHGCGRSYNRNIRHHQRSRSPLARQSTTSHRAPSEGNKAHYSKRKNYSHQSHNSSNQEVFCDYCGNDGNKNHEKECKKQRLRCAEAIAVFRKHFSSNENVLSMAIHVDFLYGLADKKEKGAKDSKRLKRGFKLQELVKIVSALRNSNSGHILIHFVGLAEADSFTGSFDEFADTKLKELILDGSLFSDIYKKKLLSHYAKCESDEELKTTLTGFNDILVLYVEGSECLITSNLQTKQALDDGIVDATDNIVFKFLANRKEFQETFSPRKQTLEDIVSLQESRCIQLKAYDPSKCSKVFDVSCLFQNRLTEYISAFTKGEEGGSFFYAVREKPVRYSETKYQSRKLEAQSVHVSDQKRTALDIKESIRDTTLVCDYDGAVLLDTDIVQVYFVPIDKTRQLEDCVVCIQARPVRGIVFHDKEGPLAYKVDIDKEFAPNGFHITKFSFKEWFKIFQKRAPKTT